MISLEHVDDTSAESALPAIRRNFELLAAYLAGRSDFAGTGGPNGVVTASPGATYVDWAGGAGTTFYVKESGVNTNTGWVGK